MNDQLVTALMDAQAVNAAQDRALFNPSPEVDSALEHALVLLKTANDSQRPHAVALVKLLGDVRLSNLLERDFERQAAGVADPITTTHEFAKLARPLLADLANPMMGPAKTAARLGELHTLFGRTGERTRTAFSLRQLLGCAKYTRLVAELAAWSELQAVGCGS